MTKLIIAIVLTLTATFANAQLKGSGSIVTKTYDYHNFNKISFEDIDGNFEVEVGKAFSISIAIDDNLYPYLTLVNNIATEDLTISFKNNRNNKLYVEDTKIKIKITLPTLAGLKNDSNGNLVVTNIKSNNLKIETLDNGSTTVSGTTNNLTVINNGNGVLNAKRLVVQNATIKDSGNGNVYVNVSEKIKANTSGNCTVVNIGDAKFDQSSSSKGNSRYINE